jgi:WD40 repeat protein
MPERSCWKRMEGIRFKPPNDQISNVTFNKPMTRAVAGCMHGSIDIWDVKSGELLSDISYGTRRTWCDLSGDGKYILASGTKEVQIYYTEIEDVLKLAKDRLAKRTSGDFSRF